MPTPIQSAEPPVSKEYAFQTMEAFLRKGAEALGRSPNVVKVITDGFSIEHEDVSCRWVLNEKTAAVLWRIEHVFTQINLVTDEVSVVGPVTIMEAFVGEEYRLALQMWLTVVTHQLEGALANIDDANQEQMEASQ